MTAGTSGRYGARQAPGDLALAQELANTVAVGPERDLLASADDAGRWLASAGVDERPLRDPDLVRLRALRAAVRAALGGEGDDETGFTIRLRVGRDGVSPAAGGDAVEAVETRLASALLQAQARGELARLKLCANPRCRVAFFDTSKNGAGRWHSAERCGNAARVRAHRERLS